MCPLPVSKTDVFIVLTPHSAFQLLGHLKTVLILLVGWIYFAEIFTERSLMGAVLAVGGMIIYGRSSQKDSEVKR